MMQPRCVYVLHCVLKYVLGTRTCGQVLGHPLLKSSYWCYRPVHQSWSLSTNLIKCELGPNYCLPSTMNKSTWGNEANFLSGGYSIKLVGQLISVSENSSVHYLNSPHHLHARLLELWGRATLQLSSFFSESILSEPVSVWEACAPINTSRHETFGKLKLHDEEEFFQKYVVCV
jgi:hypothetical protein